MVSVAQLLPLAFGIVCFILPLLARGSSAVESILSKVALVLFGRFVSRETDRKSRREGIIRAARMNTMYRVYASRTLLYATLAAIGGAFIGLYVIVLVFRILALPTAVLREVLPEQIGFLAEGLVLPELTGVELFILFLLSGVTFGSLSAAVTYSYRWVRPRRIADQRERRIEESLPRTVAFMFALSRSGMSQNELIGILSVNSKYFGEAAEEFVASLRDIEVSGRDFLTATRELALTTPSDEFATFAEDLANVLRTGRSMSEYFREEYEQYQQDKKTRQEQVLEQMSALAEGYVALLVAGPLFLITILVIIGLLIGGTLNPLRVFIYVVAPLLNIAFLLYLSGITASLGIDVDVEEYDIAGHGLIGGESDDAGQTETPAPPAAAAADGGHATRERANRQRLEWYTRIRGLRRAIVAPLRTVAQSPDTVLYVVVPVGVTYVLTRLYLAATQGALGVRAIDDYLIHATLFVAGTFSLAEYLHSNRERRIERSLPDFIDRLADQTEAGMTLTRAVKEMNPDSIPGFQMQIQQLQADLRLGARTSEALRRMAANAKSVLVSRAIVLTTNALRASGDIAPVLRIAADEAQLDRRLARRRRQELFIYQVIIYISMLVFIGITVVLVAIFIPSLPTGASFSPPSTGGAPGVGGVGGIGGIGGAGDGPGRDAYKLVLFHSAIIQSLMAGLVAGKMGEGRIRAGAKHATILLAIVYTIMVLL